MAKGIKKKTPDAPWENKKVPKAPFDNSSYGLVKLSKAIFDSMEGNTNVVKKLLEHFKKQGSRKIEVNIPEIKLPKTSDTKILAASNVAVAESIQENTRVTMNLVEYMKRQKEGKPVVVEMPKQKETTPWEHITFEVTSRDSSNLLKSFDAKRIK